MRHLARTAALLTVAIATSPAHAQNAAPQTSPAFAACLKKDGTTAGMINCAVEETARWDKRLNAAYQRLMASKDLTPATKSLLRTAQRSWVPYRAAKCAADGELEAQGGTMAGIVSANCELNETASRATELEHAAQGQ